jgi:hypothetical protein
MIDLPQRLSALAGPTARARAACGAAMAAEWAAEAKAVARAERSAPSTPSAARDNACRVAEALGGGGGEGKGEVCGFF